MITEIPIEHIIIEDRARRDFGDLERLMKSIEKYGLLYEILVCEVPIKEGMRYKLLAGERRLKAHRMLGMKHIRAKIKDKMSQSEEKEIELVENYHKEMTWQEQAQLIYEIHNLKQSEVGAAVKGAVNGRGWGIEQTAELLGLSVGTIHQALSLFDAMEFAPEIKKFTSKRQALKAVNKLNEIAALTELSKRRADSDAEDRPYVIRCGDAVDIMQEFLPDESIDLVIFDPPWGIDADTYISSRGPGGDKANYDDSQITAVNLTERLLPEIFRVMRNNTHMYMFFGIEFYDRWLNLMREIGFNVDIKPLIWKKEGGAFTDFEMKFMPCYEMVFFAAKGQRRINSPTSDVFEHNRPSTISRIHTQQKPISLLKQWIKLSTVKNEIVLDPCMGSGATVVAATSCGRRSYGIEKVKESFIRASEWIRGIQEEIGEEEKDGNTHKEKGK